MNKFGKGNGLFIIFIPLFIVFTLVVLDTIINYTNEKKYKSITESIIKEVYNSDVDYDEYYNEIKRLYEYNGYETDMLVVDADDYMVYIENEHSYIGIFSSIFGTGKEELVKLFGLIDFKLKKGSKTIIKLETTFDDDNLRFEYVE